MRGPISLLVVKGKDHIGPAASLEHSMGAGRGFDVPADAEKRGEYARGLGRRPLAHAAIKETFSSSSGTASWCSRRSAIARNARAWTAKGCGLRLSIGQHARQCRYLSDPPAVRFLFQFDLQLRHLGHE